MYFMTTEKLKVGVSITAITEEECSIMQCKWFKIFEDRNNCIECNKGAKILYLYKVEPLRNSYLRYIGNGKYLAEGVKILAEEAPIISH